MVVDGHSVITHWPRGRSEFVDHLYASISGRMILVDTGIRRHTLASHTSPPHFPGRRGESLPAPSTAPTPRARRREWNLARGGGVETVGAAGRIDRSRRRFAKAPHSVCPMRGFPFVARPAGGWGKFSWGCGQMEPCH
jgi:hypothetical protein